MQSIKYSMQIEKIINNPVFFERNRVYRVYRGGSLFNSFFGDKKENSFYPEEWIASTVHALGTPHDDVPGYGLSRIKDTDLFFPEILEKYPQEMLGPSGKFNIFAKILHSAVRLPVQVHPDRTFAEKYLNSTVGKEEAWFFLATEGDAEIYYGFKEGVTEKDFLQALDKSETDKQAMPDLLNRIKVSKGETVFVPGKLVHTIGPGCLVLEIQEATDFVYLSEHWCDEKYLDKNDMFQNLEKSTALECFSLNNNSQQFKDDLSCKTVPETIADTGNVYAEKLIYEKHTGKFSMNYYDIKPGSFRIPDGPSIVIPIEGEASLKSADNNSFIKKGDYFFLPRSASGCEITTEKGIKLVECLPSQEV